MSRPRPLTRNELKRQCRATIRLAKEQRKRIHEALNRPASLPLDDIRALTSEDADWSVRAYTAKRKLANLIACRPILGSALADNNEIPDGGAKPR